MSDFAEKLRSINFGLKRTPHTKTDEHGNTTTEHWDGRIDVTIRPQTISAEAGAMPEET